MKLTTFREFQNALVEVFPHTNFRVMNLTTINHVGHTDYLYTAESNDVQVIYLLNKRYCVLLNGMSFNTAPQNENLESAFQFALRVSNSVLSSQK